MWNDEKLKIMKTTKIYILLISFLMVGIIQATAVEYKSTYYGVHPQSTYVSVATKATAPSITFKSTSPYSAQWQDKQQQPMLNSDGSIANDPMANSPFHSGPRKGPGTPGGDLDPETQQPIGDALLPLLVMALAFVAVRRYRRRKA